MVTKFDLASAIINLGIRKKFPVSNLRLNKLMYLCQLEHYRKVGSPLIEPDSFEAWSFGPIVKNIYIEYCLWGGTPIEEFQTTNYILPDFLLKVIEPRLLVSPWELNEEVKQKDGAWERVYDKNFKKRIPENLIVTEALLKE